MNLICPECEKPMSRKIGEYHYMESGLDNVYLKNIIIYECSCGVSCPSIYKMPYLNDLIVNKLFEKRSLLKGNEIKFIRKSLTMSSRKYSKILGVGFTTYSKWENDRQAHSELNDRLIRTTALIYQGKDPKRATLILDKISEVKLTKASSVYYLIAERLGDDYQISWEKVYEPQAVNQENIINIFNFSQTASSDLDRAVSFKKIINPWKNDTRLYNRLSAPGTSNT